MTFKTVKVVSVTPEDKFDRVDKVGSVLIDLLIPGGQLIIEYPDHMTLTTSIIAEVTYTETGFTAKTKNSVYEIEFIKEDESNGKK